MTNYNQLLFECLMASYRYYWLKEHSFMSDAEYDSNMKLLYSNKNSITSRFKKLIKWSNIPNTSSLYYLRQQDYHWSIHWYAIYYSEYIKMKLLLNNTE